MSFDCGCVCYACSQYRPIKLRTYEKEERKETKRLQAVQAEALAAQEWTGGGLHHIERGLEGDAMPSADAISRVRSESGNDETIVESFGARGAELSTPFTPRVSGKHESSGLSAPQTPASSQSVSGSTHSYASSIHRYHAPLIEEHITARNFAYLSEAKLLFSCGHWDRSVRVTYIETGRLVQTLRAHRDVVSCLALAKDYGSRWLVTGSRDCTIIVWDIAMEKGSFVGATPIRTLHGHDNVVSCVCINPEINAIISGSEDGTVIIHNLRDGEYIRTIINRAVAQLPPAPTLTLAAMAGKDEGKVKKQRAMSIRSVDSSFSSAGLMEENATPSARRRFSRAMTASDDEFDRKSVATAKLPFHQIKITWVGYSKEGYIVIYSADQFLLTTFSLNGTFICSRKVPEVLHALLLSEDGKVLVTGGNSCLVVFRWVSLFCSSPLCVLLHPKGSYVQLVLSLSIDCCVDFNRATLTSPPACVRRSTISSWPMMAPGKVWRVY